MGVGSILVERGLINQEQLERAIEEQNRTGERLDHVMVRLGMVTSGEVLEVMKDLARGDGWRPELGDRRRVETRIAAESDAIVAGSPHDMSQIVRYYGAEPDRQAVLDRIGMDIEINAQGLEVWLARARSRTE